MPSVGRKDGGTGSARQPAAAKRLDSNRASASSDIARQLLYLQRAAGNAAVEHLLGVVARDAVGVTDAAPSVAPAAVAPPAEGTETNRFGIVDHDGTIGKDKDPGLNLRAGPSVSAPIVGRLDHNDHLVVKREIGGGWLYVIVTDGKNKTATGYVSGVYVNADMPPDPSAPDPGATLYRIPTNERAHDFVRRRYGAATQETGQDERFFTNVLQFVNDQNGRHFVVTKTKPKKVGAVTTEVEDKELVAGGQIWVPSLDFALSLKGTVSAGSWQRNLVEKLKNIGEKLVAIPVFIAGLLWGALESIKDLFVGLFDLVWGTIKSLGHNLLDAAKAIWGLITSAKKRRALLEAIDTELREMVEKGSFLRKAFNWGRIIGYATMEVVSFVLLAGASAALKGSKFAARLAKLFKVIEEAPAIQKIVEGAAKLSKTKTAQSIIDKLGVVKDVGKAVVESKPGRVVGKAVGTTAGGAARIAAAPGRGLLKAAEWISEALKGLVRKSGRRAGKVGGRAELAAEAAAKRASQLKDLEFDPEKGGVTAGSRGEARDALRLQDSGDVPGPIRRANGKLNPLEDGADFVDGAGQLWDHKFAGKGRWDLKRFLDKIELIDLKNGENIMLNIEALSPTDLKALLTELDARGIRARFKFIPPLAP